MFAVVRSLLSVALVAMLLLQGSPAFANRAKGTTAVVSAAKVKVRVKQGVMKAATSMRTLNRVSTRDSVKKADTAVLAVLAERFIVRGPRESRMTEAKALEVAAKLWKITDTQVLSNNDPIQHPITGNATVSVRAERAVKSLIGRVLGWKQKQEFLINIATDGKVRVVETHSNSTTANVIRAMNEKLSLSRVAKDVFSSRGVVRIGVGVGMAAIGAAVGDIGLVEVSTQVADQIHQLVPIVITGAVMSITSGVGRRNNARLLVMERLKQELGIDLARGKTISIDAAYSRYLSALREVRIGKKIVNAGVQPESRERFVMELAAWEDDRAAAMAD